MSWNKNVSGCGDSGAELTMPSDEEERSTHSSQVITNDRTRIEPPPLKEPWVPAPGKSTKVRSRSFSSVFSPASNLDQNISSPLDPSTPAGKSTSSMTSEKRGVNQVKRKGRSRTKRSKSISEPKLSGYKLKSKDSLIDVTACLNKRRDEVFKLWEQNVLNCDAALLAELENANTLAVEAANDVYNLRKTIDDLKRKTGKFAVEDNLALDALRSRILSKLELFETSHAQIQASLRVSRESSRNPKRDEKPKVQPITSKDSITSNKHNSAPSVSSSSLIYLKTIDESFSEGETDDEVNSDDFEEPIEKHEEGSKVNLILKEVKESKSRDKRERPSFYAATNSEDLVDRVYYCDKIRRLNRKLMEQEAKRVEMKREMKIMRSENDHDIKLLKANLKAQMNEMVHLPEVLEITEERLNDSLHAKFAIESTLQLKINEISAMKIEINRYEKDLEATLQKLVVTETKNEILTEKVERLEFENKELRMEISTKSQLLVTLEAKNSKAQQATKEGQAEKFDHKFIIYEDKISELETELETANKETVAMRRAKQKTTISLNRRIDELMETLEATRAKNRSLQNHINLIKTKYYQLFVPQGESNQAFPEMSKIIAEAKQSLNLT